MEEIYPNPKKNIEGRYNPKIEKAQDATNQYYRITIMVTNQRCHPIQQHTDQTLYQKKQRDTGKPGTK